MAFPIRKVRRFSFALTRVEVAHSANWALEGSAFRNRFGLRGRTGLFRVRARLPIHDGDIVGPAYRSASRISFRLSRTAKLRRFRSDYPDCR